MTGGGSDSEMDAADQAERSTPAEGPPNGDEATAGDAKGRFGTSTSRTRLALLYGGMVALIVVVLARLLQAGNGLRPGGQGDEQSGAGGAAASIEHVLWKLLLAAIVIIVAARVVGALMRRLHQPQVIGEIIAGILLGPSFLGAIRPDAQAFLFPEEILPFLDLLANVGLVFFMFLVGLELDIRLIQGRGHAAVWVSHASIIAPFLSGVALALVLYPTLGAPGASFTAFGLFIGASMAVTAFPVLARILNERGLYKTPLGAVTLTCAAVDDVTAWCLLAVVVTIARATGLLGATATIGFSLLFIVVMIVAVRPGLQRLATYHENRGRLSGSMLAALFVGILLSALVTDRIGIHVIFGAFLFGAIMPHRPAFIQELTEKIEDFSVLFLLPIFFAFSGLRTEIGLLGDDPGLWLTTLAILAVAIVGKWGGSTLAARLVGLDWRESSALGVLMNCRGLTELIILNIGLELGVLPPALFAMLVIMAVATTVMTEPLLALLYPRHEQARMVEEQEAEDDEPEAFRVVVPIGNPRTAHGLVQAARLIGGSRAEEAQIVLLHVVEMRPDVYRAAPAVHESMIEQATEDLRPLVDEVEEAGLATVPVVTASTRVADAIARTANERDADLVVVGSHRGIFGDRILGGVVNDVLRFAGCDVAVLVDPGVGRAHSPSEGGRILVPYGGGPHEDAGVDIAVRLAKATGAELTLIGPDGIGLADRASGIYESMGIWTTPVPIQGDVTAALIERGSQADFIVLGVTDRWADDQENLGEVRAKLIERTSTSVLLVRRHTPRPSALGRLARRFRRTEEEWIDPERPAMEPT